MSANRSALTPEIAALLDGSGHFRLPGPPDTNRELSEARAKIAADAFVRSYGPSLRNDWTREHQATVNVEELHPCGRAFYVASVMGALSPELSATTRDLFGPHWLVTLCGSDGAPQVSIAVSSLETGFTVERGLLRNIAGNDFLAVGIPVVARTIPIPPEEVVNIVFRETGRRVARLPDLVAVGYPYTPQVAKWHITLETPVRVKVKHGASPPRSSFADQYSDIYYGFGPDVRTRGFQLRAPSGARVLTLRDRVSESAPITVIQITVPAGTSGEFVSVEVQPQTLVPLDTARFY